MSESLLSASDRPFVRWGVRHPWPVAIGVALGGTILTAVGSAVGQVLKLSTAAQVLVLAVFVAVSALVGIALMFAGGHRPAEYGYRRPRNLRGIGYALPMFLIPVLVLVASGVHVPGRMVAAYAVLTVAVGFNEETWFRGLLPAALASRGDKVRP